jgi:hypothetical protein
MGSSIANSISATAAAPVKSKYVPPPLRGSANASTAEHSYMNIEQAEEFARSIKDRLRKGELTPAERRQCIELALRFAEPERVAAVRRAVDHAQSRRHSISVRSTSSAASTSASTPAEIQNLPRTNDENVENAASRTSPQLIVRSRVSKPPHRSCRSFACSPLTQILEAAE